MFLEDQQSQEKKLRELAIASEALLKEIEQFYDRLGIDPEAVRNYYEEPSNFTEEEWQQIERNKRNDAEQLDRLLQQPQKKRAGALPNANWIAIR